MERAVLANLEGKVQRRRLEETMDETFRCVNELFCAKKKYIRPTRFRESALNPMLSFTESGGLEFLDKRLTALR